MVHAGNSARGCSGLMRRWLRLTGYDPRARILRSTGHTDGLIFMPSVGARIDRGRRTPANLGGNHFTDRGELAWILSR